MVLLCGMIWILFYEEGMYCVYFMYVYLFDYFGEGVQYIVLVIDDILCIVSVLVVNGFIFVELLVYYYDIVDVCLFGYGLDLEVLC